MSYIFYCNDKTEQESFQKGVFGNVYKHWNTVKKIKPGSPIFLINLNTGTLFGPFRSTGNPQLYLDPYVFMESGRNYPAQVQVSWGRVMTGVPSRIPTETYKSYVSGCVFGAKP